MPRPNAVADALSHVRWLGGGSGAGKSTIARRLADAHGAILYSTDDAMADHAARCAPEQCPKLTAFKAMTMDERWVHRTPHVMLDTFPWFGGEAFDPIIGDLLALPRDRPVIAEGFRLLPRLVAPLLGDPHCALWLLPTPAFRRHAFEARGTLWDIPNRTSDPDRALANLLHRDALFTERLRRETSQLGLPAFTVDRSRSEGATVAAANRALFAG